MFRNVVLFVLKDFGELGIKVVVVYVSGFVEEGIE